jgi:hypothetical protein
MKCFRCSKPISIIRWSIYDSCPACADDVNAELQAREEDLEGIRQWVAHHPDLCAEPTPELDLNDADREWLTEMHISTCDYAMDRAKFLPEPRSPRAHME